MDIKHGDSISEFGPGISISVCTYNDDLFEVILKDADTGEEIEFVGHKKIDGSQLELINRIAPACVWTRYRRLTPEE